MERHDIKCPAGARCFARRFRALIDCNRMNQSSPVALITGAGSGIGRALARLLGQEGYAIAAVDRREEGLRLLEDELQTQQKTFPWGVADVTDPARLSHATPHLHPRL